jgi:PAS domain S-box-containing protein
MAQSHIGLGGIAGGLDVDHFFERQHMGLDEVRHDLLGEIEEQRYADVVAQGQRVDAEGVRQRKDGSRLHVSIVRVPVSVSGAQIAVYGSYRDITERKRAEELQQTFSQR